MYIFLKLLWYKHQNSDVGKCTACRFNKGYNCNVGSYYAEKGLNRICYNGELWEKLDTKK